MDSFVFKYTLCLFIIFICVPPINSFGAYQSWIYIDKFTLFTSNYLQGSSFFINFIIYIVTAKKTDNIDNFLFFINIFLLSPSLIINLHNLRI